MYKLKSQLIFKAQVFFSVLQLERVKLRERILCQVKKGGVSNMCVCVRRRVDFFVDFFQRLIHLHTEAECTM